MIKLIVMIISLTFVLADNILPAQIEVIQKLADENGFSDETLDQYLMTNYDTTVFGLTHSQGKEIIIRFQSDNPPKPLKTFYIKKLDEASELITAQSLEVGMSKRFYLIDENVINGKILSIESGTCEIETVDGKLFIPVNEILEETVDIQKKDETRFKGPIIQETFEQLVIRSKYGDVTIQKKDIKELDRFQGGRLVPKTEFTKKFYQGEAQLISIFLDPTAFPLESNTFYLSGLSVGYGFTERFMITTKFASNFGGDLNLYPQLRIYHKKTADSESALSIGLGIHRNYPKQTILAKYSHFVDVNELINTDTIYLGTLNEQDMMDYSIIVNDEEKRASLAHLVNGEGVYSEFYTVYSSRRKNPTGRGKVGWTAGFKITNAFSLLDKINSQLISDNNIIYEYILNKEPVAYRAWTSFEYDLRKNIKFVGSVWLDNGGKSKTLSETMDDFFAESENDGSSFIFDSPIGKYDPFDFDFGVLYAVNENFRIGIHFQQPYIDIYWKFFEL